MATCDTCNAETTWEVGTAYTADEFRRLVSMGYVSDGPAIKMYSMIMSREEAIAMWKNGLVAQSSTPWLLCPSCAKKAGRCLPRTAGTGPGTARLTERMSFLAGDARHPPAVWLTPECSSRPTGTRNRCKAFAWILVIVLLVTGAVIYWLTR